ncbi:metabolite traffic protein EboE [Streptomyces sp. NPDC090029]|uniref:metabolite traffic protein EboE n=1 Tax=Streptomyces sp. NPDC090029 TaxID=3365924 RepID=UPI0038243BDA
MRFRHADGSTVHLAYCTNVHPAESLDDLLRVLRDHCAAVRRQLRWERLGIGLWIARDAARHLADSPPALRTLRNALQRYGLEVVTLNGFPYAGFGDRRVKYRVYRPDWREPARLAYTTDLARLLAALLPPDATDGSVSTLPLGWRTRFANGQPPLRAAHAALRLLADRLDGIEERTGKSIRVGLEPEPGCVMETAGDAARLLTGLPGERIGVCLDTCHLATCFEHPDAAVAVLQKAGIRIVKAQLSVALHAEHPHRPGTRQALTAYAEPRFLHQTRGRCDDRLLGTDDLAQALDTDALADAGCWRAHFHLPLHAAPEPPLSSTLPDLRAAVARLVGGPVPLTRHLEVETYTWRALPAPQRPRTADELSAGIAAELRTARDMLIRHGLEESP